MCRVYTANVLVWKQVNPSYENKNFNISRSVCVFWSLCRLMSVSFFGDGWGEVRKYFSPLIFLADDATWMMFDFHDVIQSGCAQYSNSEIHLNLILEGLCIIFCNIYIHSNEIHNVVALFKCLLVLRCQLYMFRTVTVHPQELLFRCCMCRLWYVVRTALSDTSRWYNVVPARRISTYHSLHVQHLKRSSWGRTVTVRNM